MEFTSLEGEGTELQEHEAEGIKAIECVGIGQAGGLGLVLLNSGQFSLIHKGTGAAEGNGVHEPPGMGGQVQSTEAPERQASCPGLAT